MGQKTRAAQNPPMICAICLAGRLSPALLWVGPGQIPQFCLREKKTEADNFRGREGVPPNGRRSPDSELRSPGRKLNFVAKLMLRTPLAGDPIAEQGLTRAQN